MSNPLPKIGKPATNALHHINITTLEEVAKLDEKTLLKIHGVGPKAVKILEETLEEKGLSFADNHPLPFTLDFAVIGDLKCDNAPKRRFIRDFITGRAAGKEEILKDVITDDVTWHIINKEEIHGFSNFCEKVSTADYNISSVEIDRNLTHGKEGASHTTMTLNNGRQIHIADFFEFVSNKKDAKIKKITTYLMD
ncbi:DNA-directed RNA polymerase subunit alpha C-terminal domain-containing protein [Oceanobacillus sp. CFH 90083]|uniref:DNA-directed RNA polymerase subunit alpha C-terminal domain-containing protein n=1 Tax=Oceanobacillus sp. CFH 90083 TaxID=2592336 RepID=UPI00128C5F8D|nr:DNA-directed RNA polymerase subunit alpha C-terminal domain-containing protein [Oceanobacillus sp. CFH 90083]